MPLWLWGCGAPREQGRGRGSEGHGAGRGARSGALGAALGRKGQGAGRGQEDEEERKGTVRPACEDANKTARPKQKSSAGREVGGWGVGDLKTHLTAGRSLQESAPNPRGGGLGEVLGGVSDWQPGSVFQTRKKNPLSPGEVSQSLFSCRKLLLVGASWDWQS